MYNRYIPAVHSVQLNSLLQYIYYDRQSHRVRESLTDRQARLIAIVWDHRSCNNKSVVAPKSVGSDDSKRTDEAVFQGEFNRVQGRNKQPKQRP